MRNFTSYLIAVLMVLACSNNSASSRPSTEEISQKISSDLASWNLSNTVGATINHDTLEIGILYKGVGSIGNAPYYYDTFSNDLIVKTLIYKNLEFCRNFSKIKLDILFEGSQKVNQALIGDSEIETIRSFFATNSFYQNVVFSFENFDYNDVIFFNSAIKLIVSETNERFNFKGNYWELLESFNAYCAEKKDDRIDEAVLFALMCNLVKNVDYGPEEPENADRILLTILEECGISKSIYNMDVDELYEYIRNLRSL